MNCTLFKDRKCVGSSHWSKLWKKTLADNIILVQPKEGQNFFMYEDEDANTYVDTGDDKPREWNEITQQYEYGK